MTTEKIKSFHDKISKKLKLASNAAQYLKDKVARCTDEGSKMILVDLQIEAEEKAEKLGALAIKLTNKYYDQKYGGVDNYLRNSYPEQYAKLLG